MEILALKTLTECVKHFELLNQTLFICKWWTVSECMWEYIN